MHVATATTNRLQKRSSSKLTHNHDLMCKNDRGFPFFFQRWNKHYCVISDDKLYYAEEYEQEEEDPKKVKVAQLNIWMYGNKHEVSEHVFPTGLKKYQIEKIIWRLCLNKSWRYFVVCSVPQYQDMHCSEPWFHGQMKEGRQMAERRIHEYCTETGRRDGTFLVRQSDTYVTDYTLSFWYMSAFLCHL